MHFTSQSVALCTVEIAVHTSLGNIPADYTLVTLEIPDDIQIEELVTRDLPIDWKTLLHSSSTQFLGDGFISAGEKAILKVPSAVVPGEYNFLVNTSHSDSNRIRVISAESYEFDSRLFVR